VVISQGQNVLRGDRLEVDRVTGVSRMQGGRVQGIFQRSSGGDGSPAPRPPGMN
jgi:lipopolysaccharide export system protein LptA